MDVSDYLGRLREKDVELKAFACIADEKPSIPPGRPLSGMSVAVKDLIDTADFPTTYGSQIYAGYRPKTNAALVEALISAGAFITGKTTTTEFATWPPTQTLNPHSNLHTPGGSSAGSAAAVSVGLVDAALGTQTKGSVIRPASFCGVIGFKPSFNRLSRAGVKMLSESLDTVGLFANSVEVIERIYSVLTNDEASALVTAPRFAFTRTPQWSEVTPDAQAAILDGIAFLRAQGVVVDDIDMPEGFEELPEKTSIVHDYEMGRSLRPELSHARDLMDPSLAAAVETSFAISGAAHAEALLFLEKMRFVISDVFRRYDVVLCAAAPGEAPLLSENSTGSPIMNLCWTALHLPCVTLPVLKGGTGMPVGLQLVGGAYRDRDLLSAATMLESLFGTRKPDA